ncbi:CgeB family protein [Pseudomonas sp.]|uniref:CgeB family protein n=1 Tax=Pseudomonas sp. TaxID=306 RepID=UPI003CC51EA4
MNTEHPQPTDATAAHVVVFESPVVSRDCADALRTLGFRVTCLPVTEDNVMALMTRQPDYVLTINFNRYICEVCELLKVCYLAWVIDTPCYPIYDGAINNPHSFTFLYDAAIALRLRGRGVGQVYHLPVAANVERIAQIAPSGEDAGLACDVSFVANLTATEYGTLIQPKLSVSTRARCSALIDSLARPTELFQLDEQIDEALIAKVTSESGYPLAGEHYLSKAEKLAYLLGREHSWRERIELVRQLEARFALRVYGNAEWQGQIGCYAGHADHFEQMPKIFQRSKINLNLSRSFVEYGLPMRVFDVLSGGGFLVTNDKQDLHKLFTNGKDLVIFRDTQDLLEICAYYLDHEQERQAIAAQGLSTLREHHTFLLRMIDLFTTVQTVRAGQPASLSRWYP